MCFVVLPKNQKCGEGSKLIKPILKIFEEENLSLYLKTHKEVNTQIYKHFGFNIVDISSIPKTNIAQYAMMK